MFSYDEDYPDIRDYEYDEVITDLSALPPAIAEVSRVQKAIDTHSSPRHTNSSQALQRLNETLGIYLR